MLLSTPGWSLLPIRVLLSLLAGELFIKVLTRGEQVQREEILLGLEASAASLVQHKEVLLGLQAAEEGLSLNEDVK